MTTEAALLFREPLFLFALGAAAVHLAVTQIIFKKQSAAGTFSGSRFMDNRFAAGDRALEDGFAFLAPVFAHQRLFAGWTFFCHCGDSDREKIVRYCDESLARLYRGPIAVRHAIAFNYHNRPQGDCQEA